MFIGYNLLYIVKLFLYYMRVSPVLSGRKYLLVNNIVNSGYLCMSKVY